MDIPEIIFEDNHLIAINKKPGQISQGDKTKDIPLVEIVRQYLKDKYQKPGNGKNYSREKFPQNLLGSSKK